MISKSSSLAFALLSLSLATLSCSKEDAPLPSYPNEIKVNGVSFSGTVHGFTAFRNSGIPGGTALVQIASIQGLSSTKQLGFSLEYARLDDLTGTYSGDGSFDNQGNLSAAVYQEVVFTGGLPTQKGWSISESVVSTVTMNHLGNNRYQIGLDVHLEDPDEILPDVDITGIYTADFTGEFN